MKLRIFIAEHDGVFLGGFSIVVAWNVEDARKMVEQKLVEAKLSVGGLELKEVDYIPGATMIWNGDY